MRNRLSLTTLALVFVAVLLLTYGNYVGSLAAKG